MSAYTLGPWTAVGNRVYAMAASGKDTMTTIEVAVATRADTRARAKAGENARLIAAAPELLEALRPFAALLAEHHDALPNDRPVFGINDAVITAGDLRRASAAITKATGDA